MNGDRAPGIRWLAERAGVPPDELLHDPVRLLRELARATREAAELAAETASPDDDVRRAARARADDLHTRLTAGPSPGERFGRTVAQALRDRADRLRRDPPG